MEETPVLDYSAKGATPKHSPTRYLESIEKIAKGHGLALWLKRLLSPVDRAFNWIFTADYNPLYRSGTLAVATLTVTMVTGFYLLIVYRLGAPYASVAAMQEQWYLGSWIRALHRYASDLSVFFVMLHVLRMITQGKTWGARVLAWLSGVALTVFMLLVGWTGFILVWDAEGLELAAKGARMLDVFPIFPEPISHGFQGGTKPNDSFFFLNLFLHMALPLGMVFGMWIHTAKIARSVWYPARRFFWGITGALTVLAMLVPAPLGHEADLLASPGRIALNVFYNFWMPFGEPLWVLLGFFGFFGLVTLMPWWLRPKVENRPVPSASIPKHCIGCGQCALDCPYEAIDMLPRPKDQKGSQLLAIVEPSKCVSCGLCSASCPTFSVGPEGRKAVDQLYLANDFMKKNAPETCRALVVACQNNSGLKSELYSFIESDPDMLPYRVECCGTLHATLIDRLAHHFGKVIMVGCPPTNCHNRDGTDLLLGRLEGTRKPTLEQSGREDVLVLQYAEGEQEELFDRMRAFAAQKAGQEKLKVSMQRRVARVVVSVVLLLGLAGLSQVPLSLRADVSLVRLSFRLPGQALKTCVTLSDDELAKLPIQARMKERCTSEAVSYALTMTVDGKTIAQKTIAPEGLRGDRPLYVEEDVQVPPGQHAVTVRFEPVLSDAVRGSEQAFTLVRLNFQDTVQVEQGRIVLLQYDPVGKVLKK